MNFWRRAAIVLTIGLFLQYAIAAWADSRTADEKRVDAAIVHALDYLAKQQQESGAWRIGSYRESTAGTSLSIMAFMAAGHVPGEGPYGGQLKRGINWVIDQQASNGMLVGRKKSHGPMYSHGISTLMLAEVVGMVDASQSDLCRRALEKAIKLILSAQEVSKSRQNHGGWRYQATSADSDLSVTGWQLLALRAAKDNGCDVPAENIEDAVNYVKRCAVRNNRGFAYQPGSGASATRTGTGILCLEVCGAHHTEEALGGAEFLLSRPLKARDSYFFYGVYYCGVGMFKMGGKYWEETRDHLRTTLLNIQAADGSWRAASGGEQQHGTVYATGMAVLALAVEYRYLPIYQR